VVAVVAVVAVDAVVVAVAKVAFVHLIQKLSFMGTTIKVVFQFPSPVRSIDSHQYHSLDKMHSRIIEEQDINNSKIVGEQRIDYSLERIEIQHMTKE
jgi:hypothetical protein